MPPDVYDDLAPPFPLRRHQAEALTSVARARLAGSGRWWVTMPPGAGKTLVGTEVARTLGRPTVVFSPNTAIQGQWARTWTSYGASGPLGAGTSRMLRTSFTSLTYQSLAVFDRENDEPDPGPDDDVDTPERSAPPGLEELHPNGLALVERLRDAGPILLILDECHHLLEVWGRLLRDVLALLPDAVVLGLTATPPEAMTASQHTLTADLFGPVLYEARIPALVREGTLAPYSELAWLVEPTPSERDWLRSRSERFAEFVNDLHAPGFGSVSFPAWQQQRWNDQIDGGHSTWAVLAADAPELADARLRLTHAGLADLPNGAQLREPHRHDPTADDWMLLLDDWVEGCLRHSRDPRDDDVFEALRGALPAIGYVLTKRGIRAGRSGADRVVARSAAKEQAVIAIVAEETGNLSEAARSLVLCDHESATATRSARLADTPEPAGSATGVLAALLADPSCATARPLLVTGRTVSGAPGTLADLRQHVAAHDPELAKALVIENGRLTGPWRSNTWVRHVTDFFTAGGTRCLVGTRGLLGEGWDAPCVTALVDLTTATTATAVVQTRGRALRTDPARPDKVALVWSVVCVSEEHVAGGNDWDRFARKHVGYFSLTTGHVPEAAGAAPEVVDGVAGIDHRFNPFDPPPTSLFDPINIDMVGRAARRDEIRHAWASGPPPLDRVQHELRVRSDRPSDRPALAATTPSDPHELVHRDRAPTRWTRAALWLVLSILAAWALGIEAAMAFAVLSGAWLLRGRGLRQLAWERDHQATVHHLAWCVADAMQATEASPVGATDVRATTRSDGTVGFSLTGVDEATGTCFVTALDELAAPLATPRFVVRRRTRTARTGLLATASAATGIGHTPDGEVWHAVPTTFARRKADRAAFAEAWARWLGDASVVPADSPEGVGILAAQRGLDPFAVTTVIRRVWS